MPALYAHNKFGKKVIKKLPDNLIAIIKEYPNAFRLGLQGPDTLFFYKPFCVNKVNKQGIRLHHSDAFPFFEDARNVVMHNGFYSSTHAYILGFICHFVLDRQCHPLVTKYMDETGCGHIEIEGELEHYLLTLDNHTPHTYPLHRLVPTDIYTAGSIAAFYPEFSTYKMFTSMKHFRTVKKLLVAPTKRKQFTIDSLMKLSAHYNSVKGHMIYINSNKKCHKQAVELYNELLRSVPKAVELILDFENSLTNDTPVSDKFHGDFYN